jgi:hypothetical protein
MGKKQPSGAEVKETTYRVGRGRKRASEIGVEMKAAPVEYRSAGVMLLHQEWCSGNNIWIRSGEEAAK